MYPCEGPIIQIEMLNCKLHFQWSFLSNSHKCIALLQMDFELQGKQQRNVVQVWTIQAEGYEIL